MKIPSRHDADTFILDRPDMASLSGADLAGACFRFASVTEADFSQADLRGADFARADMRWADFTAANLAGADLRWSDLRWAKLAGANMRGITLAPELDVPVVPDLDRRVWEAIRDRPKNLNMSEWHSRCSSAHCWAGWVMVLADGDGRDLESRVGISAAAVLIYAVSSRHPIPDWWMDEEEARLSIQWRAEHKDPE